MTGFRASHMLGKCSITLVASHVSFYFCFYFGSESYKVSLNDLEPTLPQVYLELLILQIQHPINSFSSRYIL